MKGKQKLRNLGLNEGEDVLVVAAPGEGVLLVHLPKVLTESSVPGVLDRMKNALEKLKTSYEYTLTHPAYLAYTILEPRIGRPKIMLLNPRAKKKRKISR